MSHCIAIGKLMNDGLDKLSSAALEALASFLSAGLKDKDTTHTPDRRESSAMG